MLRKAKRTISYVVVLAVLCAALGCASSAVSPSDDGTTPTPAPTPSYVYRDAYENETMLYLPFDEEDGRNVRDASPTQKGAFVMQGNLLASPAYQSEAVMPQRTTRSAVCGSALHFDGYSEYISVPSQTLTVSGKAVTLDVCVAPRSFLWAPPQDPKESWAVQVIAGQFDRAGKRGCMLGITKFGYWVFGFGTGEQWIALYNPSQETCLKTYEWNHLTAVFDGERGVAAIHLNGARVASKQVPQGSIIAEADVPLLLGGSNEPVYAGASEITRFNGVMDEFKIYGIAKTDSEVRAHHDGLYGYHRFAAQYVDLAPHASRLAGDYYRPAYHAVPPANWMNEPHALFRYRDKWHMFYQYNATGPYWRQICWGHWVSDDDMATWRAVKEAIIPTEGTVTPDGVWTGGMAFDKQNRPVLFFTAGDDSRPYNRSNQHIGYARAANYDDPDLTEWRIADELAVVQTAQMGVSSEFRDPQVQRIGATYYMLVGGASTAHGAQKGTAHVFTSSGDDFADWTYRGELFTPSAYKSEYGTVWEMPNIARLPDENGNPTDKYIFVFSPQHGDNDVWYYIGDFDPETCRFTPDFADAKLLDYGDNVFTGPTIYTDPQTREVYISGITQDARGDKEHFDAGWAHSASCVRKLNLLDGNALGVTPAGLDGLTSETVAEFTGKSAAQAAQTLRAADGECLRITYAIRLNGASRAGFRLKAADADTYAELSFTASEMRMDTRRFAAGARADAGGSLVHDGTVYGVIYIDKASIEAFACERAVITAFAYGRGTGIVPFGDGGQASFDVRVDVITPPVRRAE